jgi:predicted fused transcriptional regulator/phosphomethylpyrimidine kinase
MESNVLILNKFDLTFREGLHLDVELCKLFRINCYLVTTAITKGDTVILKFNEEEITKELSRVDIKSLKALKLDIASGLNVIKTLLNNPAKSFIKTLIVNPNLTSKDLIKDTINYLGRNCIHQESDMFVLNSEEVELLDIPNVGGGHHKLLESLSNILNVKNVILLNYARSGVFTHILYDGNTLLELYTPTKIPKDLIATYMILKLINNEELSAVFNDAVNLAEKSLKFAVRCCDDLIPEVYIREVIDGERYRVIRELSRAVRVLEENSQLVVDLIPEVQLNIAYALPKHLTSGPEDVAAIPGRIIKVGNSIKAIAPPDFNTSKHLARALVKAMEFNPVIRAAANIRYDDLIIKAANELGFTVSFYDRSQEPPEVKAIEGATIPWGVSEAIKRLGYVPDIIYHKGDYGKEAMILILGRDPNDVVNKILRLGTILRRNDIKS